MFVSLECVIYHLIIKRISNGFFLGPQPTSENIQKEMSLQPLNWKNELNCILLKIISRNLDGHCIKKKLGKKVSTMAS
jgi:hypothetical protein